ncbi:hypothetical protein M0R45_009902 [Rubus argutus]|uniref:Uncharacterized protein n=1 Tax=Rubus argutus TaxID=59490 RepID=A0AAW1Y5U4_RUBAR
MENRSTLSSLNSDNETVAIDSKTKVNEFAEVGTALKSLKSIDDIENQLLNNLDSSIQDQEGLESLFRQLIKTRVSLLNILNH